MNDPTDIVAKLQALIKQFEQHRQNSYDQARYLRAAGDMTPRPFMTLLKDESAARESVARAEAWDLAARLVKNIGLICRGCKLLKPICCGAGTPDDDWCPNYCKDCCPNKEEHATQHRIAGASHR
jgi:hypothetical protein